MADKKWHDINSPGGLSSGRDDEEDENVPEGEPERVAPVVKHDPEIELISAEWGNEGDGYGFNKKCILKVKGRFLFSNATYKRIMAKLYCITNGKEEDLHLEVEGHLDDNGYCTLIITLYYSDEYYRRKDKEPNLKCHYKCVITCTRSKNQIESPLLEMPNADGENFGASA